MKILKTLIFPAIAGLLLIGIFISCDDEIATIGEGLIGSEPFVTDKKVFDVFAYNKKIKTVETNKLPVYQLGIFNDAVYGKTVAQIISQVQLSSTNPSFGKFPQQTEDGVATNTNPAVIDENETVIEVFLNIPYLSRNTALSNTNGDDADAKKFDLDSIFGNIEIPFNLKVRRSTYFLRDLDPDKNFEKTQKYYSDQQFSSTFVSDVLFDGAVEIDAVEKLIYKEDDPKTQDVDESKEVDSRIAPGIRVPLNNTLFQDILAKEGKPELLSQTNFKEYFRGVNLSVSSDILFLLDMTRANITVTYEYDTVDTKETTDTADDIISKKKKDFVINFLVAQKIKTSGNNEKIIIHGNAVNTFINDPYSPEILATLDTEENTSRIYLKGGSGIYAEIKLFNEDNSRELIDKIKSDKWIINEANLVFYIDRTLLKNTEEPARLFLYNAETNGAVFGSSDNIDKNNSFNSLLGYNGIIEKSSDGKGIKYTIRITEYINGLIFSNKKNATLGLTVTSDIRVGLLKNAILEGEEGNIPLMSIINPKGTVLYGSNILEEDTDKKLKLEIFYTKAN